MEQIVLAGCAEILKLEDDDLVLNIQSDEPLVKAEMVQDLYSCFD